VNWEGSEVSVLPCMLPRRTVGQKTRRQDEDVSSPRDPLLPPRTPANWSERRGDGAAAPVVAAPTGTSISAAAAESAVAAYALVPAVGSTVHAAIRRVTKTAAHGDIVAVGGRRLTRPYRCTIRVEDARPISGLEYANKTAVTCTACFRPGDVVVADVLTLGDGTTLQLTTKPSHCGVVQAAPSLAASAELRFVPKSRTAMVCSATGTIEARWTPEAASVS
jgi:exosome complex RNA-binding protein Csl4